MNRRDFLKLGSSTIRKQATSIPSEIAKVPKNTVNNLMEYDKTVKAIKTNGNKVINRGSFLSKVKKKISSLLIRNPKETTYLAKKGAGTMVNAIKTASDPAGAALKLDGRKLGKIGKFLSKFRANNNLTRF